ncbi:hypothetical protein [Bradyrhizobium sp. BR 1432]|uniref:hypothetical protein n=1 Tax=Bradyrhizobium sp. BR 1432 TaxID=3447966 RepID=UPI003EE57233
MMNACALVVGINNYQKPGIPTLFGAVADAADFADWALDPAGGNVESQSFVLLDLAGPGSTVSQACGFPCKSDPLGQRHHS